MSKYRILDPNKFLDVLERIENELIKTENESLRVVAVDGRYSCILDIQAIIEGFTMLRSAIIDKWIDGDLIDFPEAPGEYFRESVIKSAWDRVEGEAVISLIFERLGNCTFYSSIENTDTYLLTYY